MPLLHQPGRVSQTCRASTVSKFFKHSLPCWICWICYRDSTFEGGRCTNSEAKVGARLLSSMGHLQWQLAVAVGCRLQAPGIWLHLLLYQMPSRGQSDSCFWGTSSAGNSTGSGLGFSAQNTKATKVMLAMLAMLEVSWCERDALQLECNLNGIDTKVS